MSAFAPHSCKLLVRCGVILPAAPASHPSLSETGGARQADHVTVKVSVDAMSVMKIVLVACIVLLAVIIVVVCLLKKGTSGSKIETSNSSVPSAISAVDRTTTIVRQDATFSDTETAGGEMNSLAAARRPTIGTGTPAGYWAAPSASQAYGSHLSHARALSTANPMAASPHSPMNSTQRSDQDIINEINLVNTPGMVRAQPNFFSPPASPMPPPVRSTLQQALHECPPQRANAARLAGRLR